MSNKALVIFSGGLDSTTCLYQALQNFDSVLALTFTYQQHHSIELQHAKKICSFFSSKKVLHKIVSLPLKSLLNSSLLSGENINEDPSLIGKEIPTTYVPARNLIFLSIATGIAETHQIYDIYIGVNAVDYSGYPDCRPVFIHKFQEVVEHATAQGVDPSLPKVQIHTPLIHLKKHEIIQQGMNIQVPYEYTWSCYNPTSKQGDKEQPCMKCDSCTLRQRGFREAGIQDPALSSTSK